MPFSDAVSCVVQWRDSVMLGVTEAVAAAEREALRDGGGDVVREAVRDPDMLREGDACHDRDGDGDAEADADADADADALEGGVYTQ